GEAWCEAAAVVRLEEDSSERDAFGSESERRAALFCGGGASGVFGDVDAEVLAALPPEIQREVWMQQGGRHGAEPGRNRALGGASAWSQA
ncbi:unnamed protein product, partial [Laminaria digitata]